jgi:hypothetical protein
MPNWNHIVLEHLAVLRLPPEREIEIVEGIAHFAESKPVNAMTLFKFSRPRGVLDNQSIRVPGRICHLDHSSSIWPNYG